jgi:isoleucyl-tRNA synthetase
VHLSLFPEQRTPPAPALDWAALLETRSAVTKALEEARAEKRIRSSQQASLTITASPATIELLDAYRADDSGFPGSLASLFIVSQVRLEPGDGELRIAVAEAEGGKCERCWNYSPSVGQVQAGASAAVGASAMVCERCAGVLSQMKASR